MRNWFRKTSEKTPKDSDGGQGEEKQQNISSLYEIVEDHLKSLDYDQLKSISGDFADRFAAHQEIISEIVKNPPPRGGAGAKGQKDHKSEKSDEFVIIDTRPQGGTGFLSNIAVGAYPDEMILAHYDRMIRSQYDRLIDLTMDFLKEVTETEVRRIDTETAKIASDVGELRDVLTGQIERLGEDLDETRRLHRDLIVSLEEGIVEQNRKAELALRRIKILAGAVIVAGLVGGAALVLALIRWPF
jgi:hypothetical protein